jgi:3-hydroxyisobutyrate dehydrogenase-like beta-hydroxyacid dehydrogenase
MKPTHRTTVALVGLGAMGFGMACHLLKRNYLVTGYDVVVDALERFRAQGGAIAASPDEAAKTNGFLICMVANADQAHAMLFGEKGAAPGELLSPRRLALEIVETDVLTVSKHCLRKQSSCSVQLFPQLRFSKSKCGSAR